LFLSNDTTINSTPCPLQAWKTPLQRQASKRTERRSDYKRKEEYNSKRLLYRAATKKQRSSAKDKFLRMGILEYTVYEYDKHVSFLLKMNRVQREHSKPRFSIKKE
jgi:hypothetical protein